MQRNSECFAAWMRRAYFFVLLYVKLACPFLVRPRVSGGLLQSDNSKWFTAELAPHEQALRAYLRGLVNPSEIDDIVQ